VAGFSTLFGHVFDLEMCMALRVISWNVRFPLSVIGTAYLVSMPEPSGPLLFATDQRDPLPTARAKSFPDVRVPVGASRLLRSFECGPCRSADSMRKAFVIPKGRVFEYEPTPGLADPAPTLALVAVTPDPPRCVEVHLEANFLLTREEVGVARLHVFWRGTLLVIE